MIYIFKVIPFEMIRYVASLLICVWVPSVSFAAPTEIIVFDDLLTPFGESAAELHFNKARRGLRANPALGNPLQMMPEYSYGFVRNWELNLHAPTALDNAQLHSNGLKVKAQFVASHDTELGGYGGFSTELNYSSRKGEPATWNLEMLAILGYRIGEWHWTVNPVLVQPLSGSTRELRFEPSAKGVRRVAREDYVGFEYFLAAGPFGHWLPSNQRYQVLYAVWDRRGKDMGWNVGIGKGLTDASDRWVFKTIVQFPFN